MVPAWRVLCSEHCSRQGRAVVEVNLSEVRVPTAQGRWDSSPSASLWSSARRFRSQVLGSHSVLRKSYICTVSQVKKHYHKGLLMSMNTRMDGNCYFRNELFWSSLSSLSHTTDVQRSRSVVFWSYL